MKRITTLTKIACFALVAAALVATPSISRAEDSTNAPAASVQTNQIPVAKKRVLPLHGKVAAVDTTGMTFTVGNSTLVVTSTTKIFKDHKPAVFSDITVGENVVCNYKKDDAGKMNALRVLVVPAAPVKPAASTAPTAPASPAPGQ